MCRHVLVLVKATFAVQPASAPLTLHSECLVLVLAMLKLLTENKQISHVYLIISGIAGNCQGRKVCELMENRF